MSFWYKENRSVYAFACSVDLVFSRYSSSVVLEMWNDWYDIIKNWSWVLEWKMFRDYRIEYLENNVTKFPSEHIQSTKMARNSIRSD